MTKTRSKRRIIIVDDHPIVRRGLKDLLEHEDGFAVCCEADDATQAFKSMSVHLHQLAIVDLSLRRSGGIDLIKDLHRELPDLPILVFSMHDEILYAERVLRAGARGYVMKQESDTTIIHAVRHIIDGGIYVSATISERILQGLSQNRSCTNSSIHSLSDRELEVFRLMGRGVKTQDIALRLNVSAKTIETYRTRIKTKLNITNSSDLSQFAVEHWLWERRG